MVKILFFACLVLAALACDNDCQGSCGNKPAGNASLTWYTMQTEGACNCHSSNGNYPTLAMSENFFGAGPGEGAGQGCGLCYYVEVWGSPYGGCTSSYGNGEVFKVTDLCPEQGNERWCKDTPGERNICGFLCHLDIRDTFWNRLSDCGTSEGIYWASLSKTSCANWDGYVNGNTSQTATNVWGNCPNKGVSGSTARTTPATFRLLGPNVVELNWTLATKTYLWDAPHGFDIQFRDLRDTTNVFKPTLSTANLHQYYFSNICSMKGCYKAFNLDGKETKKLILKHPDQVSKRGTRIKYVSELADPEVVTKIMNVKNNRRLPAFTKQCYQYRVRMYHYEAQEDTEPWSAWTLISPKRPLRPARVQAEYNANKGELDIAWKVRRDSYPSGFLVLMRAVVNGDPVGKFFKAYSGNVSTTDGKIDVWQKASIPNSKTANANKYEIKVKAFNFSCDNLNQKRKKQNKVSAVIEFDYSSVRF